MIGNGPTKTDQVKFYHTVRPHDHTQHATRLTFSYKQRMHLSTVRSAAIVSATVSGPDTHTSAQDVIIAATHDQQACKFMQARPNATSQQVHSHVLAMRLTRHATHAARASHSRASAAAAQRRSRQQPRGSPGTAREVLVDDSGPPACPRHRGQRWQQLPPLRC